MKRTRISNKDNQKVVQFLSELGLRRYKFKELIYDNKLYIKTEDKFKSLKIEWETFKVEGDLMIKVRLHKLSSDSVDKRISTIGHVIESKLESELIERIETVKYIDYVCLLKRTDEDSICADDEIIEDDYKTTKITLNKHFKIDLLKQPGIITVGRSGTGKTSFLLYLIRELAKSVTSKRNICICDCKFSDLKNVAKYHKYRVAEDFKQVDSIVDSVYKEFDRRLNNNIKNDKKCKYPPIILLFDEFALYKSKLDDKKKVREFDDRMKDIATTGRELYIYLIYSLQRPEAEIITGSVRHNFATRIAFGTIDDDTYRMLFTGDRLSKITKQAGEGIIEIEGRVSSFKSVYCYSDLANE